MRHLFFHGKRALACLLLVAGLLCALPSCAQRAEWEPNGGVRVLSTIFPPYDFARQIGGERVQCRKLVPAGTESHDYEPTPADLLLMRSADVFLYIGGESDVWVDRVLASMDTSEMTIVRLIDYVDPLPEEEIPGMGDAGHAHDHEHDHEEGGEEYDEHIWTSPENAEKMVEAILNALIAVDEEGEETYRQAAAAYEQSLAALDEALRQVSDTAVRRTLLFGERFPFRYLAEAYGFSYYAAFSGCSTETEPSPRTLARMVDLVREEGIPVVFQIEFSSGKAAQVIQAETGIEILTLHSCHNLTQQEMEQGETYLSLMQRNVANLREALC